MNWPDLKCRWWFHSIPGDELLAWLPTCDCVDGSWQEHDSVVHVQMPDGTSKHLLACFVPTNHVYLGDVLLLSADDVIHTGMTVSEGMGAPLAPVFILRVIS